MMRIALKFAYDGKDFYGYGRQPNLRTVEGELINSLIKNDCIKNVDESSFRSGSRTDKATSAFANVVAFNTEIPGDEVIKKLSDISQDIVVYAHSEADTDLYPRYAKQRIYRYYLKTEDLVVKKIKSTSSIFLGQHNFSNFARIESFKDPVRSIDKIILFEEENFLKIDFYAQTFLWHQIRRMISALMLLGQGKIEENQIKMALENPDKKVDFGVAKAHPLILLDVLYDFDFTYDDTQLKKSKELGKTVISNILK